MGRIWTAANGRMIGLLWIALLLSSCASTTSQTTLHQAPLQSHALEPDSKLSLGSFTLRGAAGSNTAWLFGILGAISDEVKRIHDMPYANELAGEFVRIYEGVLKEDHGFSYVPMDKLDRQQDGQLMPPQMIAEKNSLDACLTAQSDLLVLVGWKKKVKVATTWEITGRSSWKLKIKTQAVSKKPQGMFPDTADPKLKPVFLELAQESVNQFLAKLAEQGMLRKLEGR